MDDDAQHNRKAFLTSADRQLKANWELGGKEFSHARTLSLLSLKFDFALYGGAIGLVVTLLTHLGILNLSHNQLTIIWLYILSVGSFIVGILYTIYSLFWFSKTTLIAGQMQIKSTIKFENYIYIHTDEKREKLKKEVHELNRNIRAVGNYLSNKSTKMARVAYIPLILGIAFILIGIVSQLSSHVCIKWTLSIAIVVGASVFLLVLDHFLKTILRLSLEDIQQEIEKNKKDKISEK